MSVSEPGAATSAPRTPGWIVRVADRVGSVEFGVSVLALLLAYCWIGSAGFAPFAVWFVRQTFEKTELEWFTWWPFHVLVGLLALSLVLVTLRKIRFNLPNLGVWTVHTGVLVLIAGSVVYYARKVEGDAVIYRCRAVIEQAGAEPAVLDLARRDPVRVTTANGDYEIAVSALQPDYSLRSPGYEGRVAYAVQLSVTPVGPARDAAQPFVRQLLLGYPEFTEDVLAGRGRAVRVLGRKLVDPALAIRLERAPVDRFYVHDRRALYVRDVGSRTWYEAELEGLPRYHERLADPRRVAPLPAGIEPGGGLTVGLRWRGDPPPLAREVEARVVSFVPYAVPREEHTPGGSRFDPIARVALAAGSSRERVELLAAHPDRDEVRLAEDLSIRFVWLDDAAALERLLDPAPPRLEVRVPDRNVRQSIPLARLMSEPVAVPDTDYVLEGLDYIPDGSAATPGAVGDPISVLRVRIHGGPAGELIRAVVAPRAELSQDFDTAGERHAGLLDPGIELALADVVRPGIVVVGGAAGTHVLLVSRGGSVLHRRADPSTPVAFLGGALQVVVEAISPTSRAVVRPQIVPPRQRDRSARDAYQMIELQLAGAGETVSEWLAYSPYPHPNRIGFFPRRVRLPSGREIEVVFSRVSHPLPAPLALDAFRLETYPGRDLQRDYVSRLRFATETGWSDPFEVRSNQPADYAGWWFFQSTWDPPDPQRGYRGLNYTGIGVGNRHGVLVMLAGALMTVAGTLWAFYVKPVLLARRARAGAERRERARAARRLAASAIVAASGGRRS